MLATEVIQRAKNSQGSGCIYKLGQGGMNPTSAHPWNSLLECDCSGFVAWCWGLSRKTDHPWYRQFDGGWLETSAIFRDAMTPAYGMFDKVALPEPGDLIVYGDQGGHQGHVGLIATSSPVSVIHCSKSAYEHGADAIAEAGPGHWLMHGGIYARMAPIG